MSNWLFPERDVEPAAVEPAETDVDPLSVDDIEPGTNVLVAGPAMTGKRRLAFDVVGGSASKTACLLSTKAHADRIRSWFATTVPDVDAWRPSIVDCTGGSQQFGHRSNEIRTVASPGDLTGVGIELSGVFQDWYHDDVVDPRLALHSLSTMLMYADLKRVFQFCYVVRTRLQQVGAVSAFTLDTATRQSETYGRLTQVFDTVVEVDDREDGPAFRVRGGDFGPSTWTAF